MGFIADVFDVIVQDLATGDTIATTTLQEANIEVTVDESDIRAGRGNALIGVLHSNRDIAISLSDVAFNPEFLATRLGQDIITGAGTAYAMPKNYTTVDVDTVTTGDQVGIVLDKTPSDTASVRIYNASGQRITGFSVSGATVTFAGSTPAVAKGDVVDVRTYKYATASTTQTLEMDTKTFAKGVRVIMSTIEVDGDENILADIQYQFDKCTPNGSFSISTSSERSANAYAFDLRVLKPDNSTVIGKMVRVPV